VIDDSATLPGTVVQPSEPALGRAPTDTDGGARYDLGPVLGRGGMGEIRLARDLRIDREVAVKLMRGDHRDEPTIARFFREARTQGALEHPAIVPVHDLGIDGDGNPYFVMKRLAGTTLHDVLSASSTSSQHWPRRQLLTRFVDVCLAIEFAHTRGIIHGDIKPANLMLGDFGEAYVLDWGLARVAEDFTTLTDIQRLSSSGEGHAPTVAGVLLGTPGYMAPEQLRGETALMSADVFSLGLVLFEILTGGVAALPHGLEALDPTLSSPEHRPSRVPDSDVPPELDDLCARATANDREGRPSARIVAEQIQAYLDGDRDLARRRELAAEHAGRAQHALTGVGDAARSLAMREAGSALALDPSNAIAQNVLGTLLLEAPDVIPAEALASADLDRGRTRQNVIRWAGFGFLGLLPALGILAFLPVRHLWPVIATAVMTVVSGAVAVGISRRPMPMRSRWFLVLLACNCVLLACVGLLFSPLLIMPIFIVSSMAGWLPQSTTYPPWIIVVAHALPICVLLALEQIGVLPTSMSADHGAVVITTYAIELTSSTTVLIFALALIAQASHLTIIKLTGRRAAEAAQNRQHAQSWHLRQLLPRDHEIAGSAPKQGATR
jgi:tRNA A-37 threonylcarbamoyl transferase component Bud32